MKGGALRQEADVRIVNLIAKLRAAGHRITPQRLAILQVLIASDTHPTVDQVYAKVKAAFPTTSLATVYKTVSIAKAMGEALELEFSQGSNRYDGNKPYPHPHVICTQCQKIIDYENVAIDAMVKQIRRATGFKIDNHRLDFYGTCSACQEHLY
jgi:Fur family peroxide stress response transcriptional regulator